MAAARGWRGRLRSGGLPRGRRPVGARQWPYPGVMVVPAFMRPGCLAQACGDAVSVIAAPFRSTSSLQYLGSMVRRSAALCGRATGRHRRHAVRTVCCDVMAICAWGKGAATTAVPSAAATSEVPVPPRHVEGTVEGRPEPFRRSGRQESSSNLDPRCMDRCRPGACDRHANRCISYPRTARNVHLLGEHNDGAVPAPLRDKRGRRPLRVMQTFTSLQAVGVAAFAYDLDRIDLVIVGLMARNCIDQFVAG